MVARDGEMVVIVPTRRGARGQEVLALPKGHVEAGESAAEAAARECREETGVEVELVEKLGDVRYWYQRDGRRIFKVVSFFLFRATGGSVEDHDHEVEVARWTPMDQAAAELSYDGEREMVARAIARAAGAR